MRFQIYEHLSDEQLAKLEVKILKEGLLKLSKTPKETFATRKNIKLAVQDILELIRLSYFDIGININTLYARNGRVQCTADHIRRSQGDLFRVVKYYYPDTTFKDFRAALFNLTNEGKVQVSYCNTIYKRVFCSTGRKRAIRSWAPIYNPETADELGLTLSFKIV